jgi:hypothetical protein
VQLALVIERRKLTGIAKRQRASLGGDYRTRGRQNLACHDPMTA